MYTVPPSRTLPFINILSDNDENREAAEIALKTILSKPHGRTLLSEIADNSTDEKKITIISANNVDSSCYPQLTKSQLIKYNEYRDNDKDWSNKVASHISNSPSIQGIGEGVSSNVFWNKSVSIYIDSKGENYIKNDGVISFISLAHELNHAYYLLKGDYLSHPVDEEDTPIFEEYRAMGVHQYENIPYSENAIRREHNIELRKNYYMND